MYVQPDKLAELERAISQQKRRIRELGDGVHGSFSERAKAAFISGLKHEPLPERQLRDAERQLADLEEERQQLLSQRATAKDIEQLKLEVERLRLLRQLEDLQRPKGSEPTAEQQVSQIEAEQKASLEIVERRISESADDLERKRWENMRDDLNLHYHEQIAHLLLGRRNDEAGATGSNPNAM